MKITKSTEHDVNQMIEILTTEEGKARRFEIITRKKFALLKEKGGV